MAQDAASCSVCGPEFAEAPEMIVGTSDRTADRQPAKVNRGRFIPYRASVIAYGATDNRDRRNSPIQGSSCWSLIRGEWLTVGAGATNRAEVNSYSSGGSAAPPAPAPSISHSGVGGKRRLL